MENKTSYLIKVSMLGALAGVLMFIKFPLPIAPSFYKLEISDACALIGGYALGPLAGVLICGVKILINLLFEGTTTAFVGEISNFIMSSIFCVSASLVYKHEHTKKGAIKSLIIGVICLVFISGIVNYFLLIPAYVKFMNFPLAAIIEMGKQIIPFIDSLFKLVIFCTIPFNLIKGICISVITYIVYKRISPLLKGKQK